MPASNPSRLPRTSDDDRSTLAQRITAAAPRLRSFLRRMGAGGDADDMLQDVMERALRYQHAFDAAAGSLDNWLMKTAFRTFLDHRERARRRPRALGAADGELQDGTADTAESRDEIGFLLRHLAPVEQDIVLRFHHRRETIAEIGRALRMPVGTVKSHLHRARCKLTRARGSNP